MKEARAPFTFESPRAGRRRRRLAARWAAAVPLSMGFACMASIISTRIAGAAEMLLFATAFLPLVVTAAIRLIDGVGATRPARISVADEMLKIERSGRVHSVPLTAIDSAWFDRSAGVVSFALQNGDHVHAKATAWEADMLLHAAGAEVTNRAHVVPLRGLVGTPSRVLVAGMLPALAVVMLLFGNSIHGPGPSPLAVGASAVVATVLAALAMFATAKWLGAPRLVIGADGIRTQHMGWQRFVPYAEIEKVTRGVPGYDPLLVVVRNGPPLELPVVGQSPAEVDALVARIEAGQRASRDHDPEAALDALGRNGRSMEVWRRDLEALLRGAEGYRRIQITHDELLAVLDNAGARAEHRVTAAVALSVLGGSADAERIRVAAGATANEKVRVALDGVANGEFDEEVLEAATATEASKRAVR